MTSFVINITVIPIKIIKIVIGITISAPAATAQIISNENLGKTNDRNREGADRRRRKRRNRREGLKGEALAPPRMTRAANCLRLEVKTLL